MNGPQQATVAGARLVSQHNVALMIATHANSVHKSGVATGFPIIYAEELADYVLAKCGPMSHLKLQKLLYYIQAWHLALYGAPIIDEDFKAWVHGPVCVSVWHAMKDLAVLNGGIEIKPAKVEKIKSEVEKQLSDDQIALIADVLDEYGDKSAHHLECLTHSERPWLEARGELPEDAKSSNRISRRVMRDFYRSKLK